GRFTTPKQGGGEWVLSGLLRCGTCGETMYGRFRRKATPRLAYRYFCARNDREGKDRQGKGKCKSRSILQEVVLVKVARKLRELYEDPERLAGLTAELAEREAAARAGEQAELESVEAALKVVGAKIDQA